MKKIFIFIVCLVMIFSLSACGGDIKNVKILEVKSDIYTSDDIQDAIDTIKNDFDKDWDGCTLKTIYYGGDEIYKDYKEWEDRYNADEVMVLLSSFDVDSSGGDGSLTPNTTYDGWNWILVRDKGGQWKHVDHGY